MSRSGTHDGEMSRKREHRGVRSIKGSILLHACLQPGGLPLLGTMQGDDWLPRCGVEGVYPIGSEVNKVAGPNQRSSKVAQNLSGKQ